MLSQLAIFFIGSRLKAAQPEGEFDWPIPRQGEERNDGERAVRAENKEIALRNSMHMSRLCFDLNGEGENPKTPRQAQKGRG